MAAKTLSMVAITVFVVDFVQGYYCDSDKCSDEEYCCGYNLCCKSYKVWDLWYFWCGLLFFVFLLSVCVMLCRIRARSSLLVGGYNYAPLSQDHACVHTCATGPVLMSHGASRSSGLHANPPPYCQPSASQNKATVPPPAYSEITAQKELHGH
ncbi:vesicular, overexpressed in cancer, prosurvival protein 1-like [Pomacea canaliculata]|uniref:vesicular, overexpressed in cancer, prosurvival protein 1-like n=1 Tax=Pomacea canaliculata TaxID=400727 RepID=UPI000D7334E3|nr:vesicular, overexpressed in cancer, prosurvival protein 1-like [Pomacea canaliculata]